MDSYIVCCGTNGRAVIFGQAETAPKVGKPFSLHNARMVLYWPSACGGLFGLAANGAKAGLRLTAPVTHHADIEAKQVLGVSEAAAVTLVEWASYDG